MKIQHKIVIPFVFLLSALILSSAFLSFAVFSGKMDREARERIFQTARSLAGTGFILDSGFLTSVKQVVGAEFVVYTGEGKVLTSTLSGVALLPLIQEFKKREEGFVTVSGLPHRYVSRPLHNPLMPPGSALAVLTSTAEIREVRRELAGKLILLSAAAILIVAVVGYGIGRGITRPLQNLVNGTRKLADGDLEVRVPEAGRDEVGLLSSAFNEMVSRLRVSETKRLEAEKQAAVGRLAAAVAHEIRNPLSSIKLLVQLLGSGDRRDVTAGSRIDAILGEIQRVDLIVGELLDLGKPLELRCSPRDLREIVRDVLLIMEAQLGHHKIRLAIDLDPDPDLPPLEVDADRLKQVIFNLLLNAMEAMPEGGDLHVRLRGGDPVRLEIADTGMGIPFEDPEQAFAPFVTTKKDGVGMGLSVARNIVEAHGGRLRLLREEKGTRAVIELPRGKGRSWAAS
ncbi:MAG: HAMP domain-containing protein [Nitrospirae bacterium]|nr:HAMP domain-containing protein [Nitrospirota bacterium]